MLNITKNTRLTTNYVIYLLLDSRFLQGYWFFSCVILIPKLEAQVGVEPTTTAGTVESRSFKPAHYRSVTEPIRLVLSVPDKT